MTLLWPPICAPPMPRAAGSQFWTLPNAAPCAALTEAMAGAAAKKSVALRHDPAALRDRIAGAGPRSR